jgi:DNA-binding NtrC family response regulator
MNSKSVATPGWCSLSLVNPRILLVEDDPDFASVMVKILKTGGAQVRHVVDGHTALVIARKFNPDLVITDLNLPHIKGGQFLGELRKLGFNKPAIIISGSGDIKDFSEAFKHQVHAYLIKPFDLSKFVTAVQQALSKEYNRLLQQQELSELWDMARGAISTNEIKERAAARLNEVRARSTNQRPLHRN